MSALAPCPKDEASWPGFGGDSRSGQRENRENNGLSSPQNYWPCHASIDEEDETPAPSTMCPSLALSPAFSLWEHLELCCHRRVAWPGSSWSMLLRIAFWSSGSWRWHKSERRAKGSGRECLFFFRRQTASSGHRTWEFGSCWAWEAGPSRKKKEVHGTDEKKRNWVKRKIAASHTHQGTYSEFLVLNKGGHLIIWGPEQTVAEKPPSSPQGPPIPQVCSSSSHESQEGRVHLVNQYLCFI